MTTPTTRIHTADPYSGAGPENRSFVVAVRAVAREEVARLARQLARGLEVVELAGRAAVRRHHGDRRRARRLGRWNYAITLYEDDGATLDDLREAVTTLEETERIARRIFGGANPLTERIERSLRYAQAALRACKTPPPLPRTIDAALSYLEEASPEALATHRVRLVALADRATVGPQPSATAHRDDEDALD